MQSRTFLFTEHLGEQIIEIDSHQCPQHERFWNDFKEKGEDYRKNHRTRKAHIVPLRRQDSDDVSVDTISIGSEAGQDERVVVMHPISVENQLDHRHAQSQNDSDPGHAWNFDAETVCGKVNRYKPQTYSGYKSSDAFSPALLRLRETTLARQSRARLP